MLNGGGISLWAKIIVNLQRSKQSYLRFISHDFRKKTGLSTPQRV